MALVRSGRSASHAQLGTCALALPSPDGASRRRSASRNPVLGARHGDAKDEPVQASQGPRDGTCGDLDAVAIAVLQTVTDTAPVRLVEALGALAPHLTM